MSDKERDDQNGCQFEGGAIGSEPAGDVGHGKKSFHGGPALREGSHPARGIEVMRRGFGALVLLLGSALVYEGSTESRSRMGTGLGLLLLLAGSSLVLDLPPEGEGGPTP